MQGSVSNLDHSAVGSTEQDQGDDPIDRSGPDGRGRRLAKVEISVIPTSTYPRAAVTDSCGHRQRRRRWKKCHETAIWTIAVLRKQQDHDKGYIYIAFAQTDNLEEHKLPIQNEPTDLENS